MENKDSENSGEKYAAKVFEYKTFICKMNESYFTLECRFFNPDILLEYTPEVIEGLTILEKATTYRNLHPSLSNFPVLRASNKGLSWNANINSNFTGINYLLSAVYSAGVISEYASLVEKNSLGERTELDTSVKGLEYLYDFIHMNSCFGHSFLEKLPQVVWEFYAKIVQSPFNKEEIINYYASFNLLQKDLIDNRIFWQDVDGYDPKQN